MRIVCSAASIGVLCVALASGASVGDNDSTSDVRNVSVPGSDVVLRLWERECGDGMREQLYSVALDGRSFSRAREARHLIRLRFAQFDPMVAIPIVPVRLRARSDGDLYIVQFVTQPVEAMREALRARGAVVWTYLADHGHIVRMTPGVREQVSQLSFIRWVGPVHTAYKLEEEIIAQIESGASVAARRYSIMLYERGETAQQLVMATIAAAGGTVHGNTPTGFRIEASMTLDLVLEIAKMDDVMFIDRKGQTEADMDIAREIGGANFLEDTLGFTGQGVRGEVADTEVDVNHREWLQPPIIHRPGSAGAHGTSVYGILFARGVNPRARGLIPDGIGIFAYSFGLLGGGPTRYTHTAELVDPDGPYRAVFQTNSTGDPRTEEYTTISAEMDDILFINDILVCQSLGNAGTRIGRPQSWAKNVVTVGGVIHHDTLTRADDNWGNAASVGPASDGRVKPTLIHFYDSIFTTSAGDSYREFGGASGATPIVAGHFGLMFQMWHEEVFQGFGGNETVFDSRPHMSTSKALLVNTAFRYDWNAGGPNGDLNRDRQGWGMPDLRELYEYRDRILIVDESDVLTEFETTRYSIDVEPREPLLRATLVYTDPRGNVGAAQHRINDLSLRVIDPSGVEYWGNNGLRLDNFSTPGGASNTIDTVENVFVADPEPGEWIVEIIADEINQDAHVQTPEVDADYALVITGGVASSCDPCDMNCDGSIDAFDIEPFLELLFGPGVPCDTCTGDVNGDGVVDAFDIEPFLECLFP